jgi:hypothetical protein
MDMEFANLAHERTRRQPFRTYIWIPMRRAAAMWFTPRTAILPYSGHLWPQYDGWREGPAGFAITLGVALLNFCSWALRYVALCTGATLRPDGRPRIVGASGAVQA